jgi:hypothetical protein
VSTAKWAAELRKDAEQQRAIKANLKASRDDRIVRAWNGSSTIVEIATQHGMAVKTVTRILVRAGVHVPKGRE